MIELYFFSLKGQLSAKGSDNIKTLAKAMEVAQNYIDDVPSRRTLNRYITRGVLPSYEYQEYLGSQGKNTMYNDDIVPAIIVAVKLRGKMTLDEIARARKGQGEFTKIYQQKLEEIKQAIK